MFMAITTIAQNSTGNAMIVTMIQEVHSVDDMMKFGQQLGGLLRGGEVCELVGDVGAGKTTLVKGLALGLGIDEDVQSPSFTISRVYSGRDDIRLAHYDFYRLHDAGIMAAELSEAVADRQTVVVVEWADIASDVLPTDRVTIRITPLSEDARTLECTATGERSKELLAQWG